MERERLVIADGREAVEPAEYLGSRDVLPGQHVLHDGGRRPGPTMGSPPSAYVYAGGTWTATKPTGEVMLHVVLRVAHVLRRHRRRRRRQRVQRQDLDQAGPAGRRAVPGRRRVLVFGPLLRAHDRHGCGLRLERDVVEADGRGADRGDRGAEVSCVSSTWCRRSTALVTLRSTAERPGPSRRAGESSNARQPAAHVAGVLRYRRERRRGRRRFDGAAGRSRPASSESVISSSARPDLSRVGQSCVAVAQGHHDPRRDTFTDARRA